MGVQQIIANNDNVLIGAAVEATSVTPSAEISRTAITRAGTGLVELSGLYTGHESADYDIEIVTGEGNGRASAPVFSGVGSGSIAVTAAALPAQDVTITLLTPPYPGATAEARIGADIIKATAVGTGGNLISITVDRSGLSFAASGSSTLEAIAEGTDELTNYKWDIPGVVCSTDLKGNVPSDAPRVRLGSDPTIYRIIKDSRSGTLKTILTPPAVRPIPTGAKIWIVTGTYAAAVTDGTGTESYTGIVTGYDLLSALLASTIVQPAYTPAPVTTANGNAAVDLPLVTGSTALLTDSSSAGVRPDVISARTTANADTIRMQSKGNGTWSVTSAAGTVYPDAFEGQVYAPAASPVLLTIPAKPQPETANNTQPVYLADTAFVDRNYGAYKPELLPLMCIEGVLGINATPKTITATYAVKPSTDECPCPTDRAIFSSYCLGIDPPVTGGGDDVDPTLKAKLTELYTYREAFVRANTDKADVSTNSTTTVPDPDNPLMYRAIGSIVIVDAPYVMTIPTKSFSTSAAAWSYLNGFAYWVNAGVPSTTQAADVVFSGGLYHATGTRTFNETGKYSSVVAGGVVGYFIDGFTSSAACSAFIESVLSSPKIDRASTDSQFSAPMSYGGGTMIQTSTTTLKTPRGAAIDIAWMDSALTILADALDIVYADATALAAWGVLKTEVFSDLDALKTSTTDDLVSPNSLYLERYRATVDNILLSLGIVPGKSDTLTGSTGCWEDSDAGFWWRLSDGYAPAFTGVEYYSTRSGSFENSQEFAFMIKCGCEDKLKVGDTLTIQIGGNLAALVWSSNEFLEITTIPTTPMYLAGGKNPDDAETWSVTAKDSSNAALPAATLDATNRGYSSAGLEFTVAAGGIPFNVGDRFSFTVEGGTFKWRRDAGTWSAATDISDNTLLDSGLYVSFLSGAAPSFMSGDSYSFRADQVSAATSLLIPDNAKWAWPDSTASIILTLSTPSTLSTLALLHSLPAGAAIAVDYWDADTTTMVPLPWASGVVRDYLHITTGVSITTTAIRITVDAPGSIRWLWAGVPFQPSFSAALRLRKQYDMVRAKAAGSAVLLGEGTGASIAWDFLSLDDADKLLNLMRYVKVHGDQPVILIPQHLHPEEWALSRLADDGIEITDLMQFQPDDVSNRILSGTMELTPEWR